MACSSVERPRRGRPRRQVGRLRAGSDGRRPRRRLSARSASVLVLPLAVRPVEVGACHRGRASGRWRCGGWRSSVDGFRFVGAGGVPGYPTTLAQGRCRSGQRTPPWSGSDAHPRSRQRSWRQSTRPPRPGEQRRRQVGRVSDPQRAVRSCHWARRLARSTTSSTWWPDAAPGGRGRVSLTSMSQSAASASAAAKSSTRR